MLPILLKLGPITIYSYGLFLAMGLFAGLYWFWKMGRDEHWDETWIFDTYFLAVLGYLVGGRVGYVFLNPELFSLTKSLSLLSHPGLDTLSGIVVSLVVVLFLSRRAEIDPWKVVDTWVVVSAVVMVIGSIGAVLNGSMPGIISDAFGYIHPGDTVPRLSGDIWTFIWSLFCFGVVSRVRKNFRFYSWYKGESSVARDGLAFLVWGGMGGIYYLILGLIVEGYKIGFVPALTGFGLILVIMAMLLVYYRSGKNKKKG
jgi:prolipoprotein diacylglyceryltransferase